LITKHRAPGSSSSAAALENHRIPDVAVEQHVDSAMGWIPIGQRAARRSHVAADRSHGPGPAACLVVLHLQSSIY
jgi:hypothetical protein